MRKPLPICVDLDGTLLKTDLLCEAIIQLIKRNPFHLFKIFGWRLKGKAFFKSKVAEYIPIKSQFLPYNQKVLNFLEQASKNAHPLFLATGAPKVYAEQIANHLGCFEKVFSSDGSRNLIKANKANSLVDFLGEKGFSYIGNSKDDIPIWKMAKDVYFVNTPMHVQKKVRLFASASVIDEQSISLSLILKQLRVYQWAKNFLLFVPLIASHSFSGFYKASLAFLSFSFLSSAIYVMNDLCDLEADRQHPTKKNRPLASGALPIQFGLLLPLLLLPLSFALAQFLPYRFTGVLLFYLVINIGYNLVLKTRPIIDVLSLSMLYLLRILGGHVVAGVAFSPWLTTFSLFFFLSLALIKRYTECITKETVIGRGYSASDASFISALGITSNAISILVFALYLNSNQVLKVYRSPEYLWIFIPVLFYWINRLWLKASRMQMHDDPVVFALKDRISHYLLVILAFSILAAYYL
jgi:4-hydroxybenzoate polyprenyltransferase